MNDTMLSRYFVKKRLPHIWCPGCGNGIVLSALAESIDKSGFAKDKTCIVSGIGCAGRASGYLNFDSMHTLHGRAIAFASGIKLANPNLNVIVITGDGDCTAIGGNHFIHACRRNIDLNVIVFNNNIYGMTGGQYSPTTPKNTVTTTSTYGMIERQFDILSLAQSAGASFAARGMVYYYNNLVDIIRESFNNKGFSVVEAITPCPVQYGRRNKMSNPSDLMGYLKDAVSFTDDNKIKLGILKNSKDAEYVDEYLKITGQV